MEERHIDGTRKKKQSAPTALRISARFWVSPALWDCVNKLDAN